jgi:hypothetical protein
VIPDNGIRDLVMSAICAHSLPPLAGKHCRLHRNAEDVVQKRAGAECDHKRAEMSVLSDWVGAIPRHVDKQSVRTSGFSDTRWTPS